MGSVNEGSWLLATRVNEPVGVGEGGHGVNGCWDLKTWVPPARAHWVTRLWGNETCMTGHWGQACVSILKYPPGFHGSETWGFYFSVLPYKPGTPGGMGCKVEWVVVDGTVLVAQVWVRENAPVGWVIKEQYWNPQHEAGKEGLEVYGRMERKTKIGFLSQAQAKAWARGLVEASVVKENV